MHAGNYNGSVGLGMVAGRFVGGAQVVKRGDRNTYSLGSDNIPFNLPTDIFNTGHYLTGIGAGVKTNVGETKVFAFAGATSTSFNSPFFDGAMFQEPAALLLLNEKIGSGWTQSSLVLVSNKITAIHSFAYDSEDGVKAAISAGVGANNLYAATSLSVTRPWIDVKASYIEADSNFRRADVAVPLNTEPDKENILVIVRPERHVSFSVGRQNFLSPVYGSAENVKSSVNQIGANLNAAGFSFSAMGFQSKFGSGGDTAMSLSATRAITSRIRVQGTYLESKPDNSESTKAWLTTVQEILTPRWTLSETVNSSGGQNTIGFGGSFLSNFATLSADYQTYYVPARVDAPFQQALMLSAQFHLFGLLTLNAGTFVAPDGRTLYTTEAEGSVMRRMSDGPASMARNAIGTMMLQGRVLDTGGQPVMGAAILVDQVAVYTDSDGYFYMRERKPRTHPLRVLSDQFLDGSSYRVVSAPTDMRSSGGEIGPELTIVVERTAVGGQ